MIDSIGGQLVANGFSTEEQLREVREQYERWAETMLIRQVLAMRAVTGIVP